MSILLKNIFSLLDATFIGNHSENTIENVSIDSRSLHHNPQTLFFCLIGQSNNGHDYIEELIEKGVRNFVVSQQITTQNPNVNFLVVKNTLKALQQFAAFYRKKFNFPVIGITGSNGKTIVKEWLNFLLSPEFKLSESLAKEIVAYLESGSTILEFVSPTTDPYNSADQVPNIILTDGLYVWDAIIIHWIKKYRVRLPDEFLTHYELLVLHFPN